MDCSAAKGTLFPLFSGGQIRSPVSRRALGECNAIRKRGFGHIELTLASTSETEVGNRRYLSRPFWATDGRSVVPEADMQIKCCFVGCKGARVVCIFIAQEGKLLVG